MEDDDDDDEENVHRLRSAARLLLWWSWFACAVCVAVVGAVAVCVAGNGLRWYRFKVVVVVPSVASGSLLLWLPLLPVVAFYWRCFCCCAHWYSL